jgi:hypothetical protein
MPMNVAAWHGEQIKEQHKARAIDRFFTRLIPHRRQARNAQAGLAGPGQKLHLAGQS